MWIPVSKLLAEAFSGKPFRLVARPKRTADQIRAVRGQSVALPGRRCGHVDQSIDRRWFVSAEPVPNGEIEYGHARVVRRRHMV